MYFSGCSFQPQALSRLQVSSTINIRVTCSAHVMVHTFKIIFQQVHQHTSHILGRSPSPPLVNLLWKVGPCSAACDPLYVSSLCGSRQMTLACNQHEICISSRWTRHVIWETCHRPRFQLNLVFVKCRLGWWGLACYPFRRINPAILCNFWCLIRRSTWNIVSTYC